MNGLDKIRELLISYGTTLPKESHELRYVLNTIKYLDRLDQCLSVEYQEVSQYCIDFLMSTLELPSPYPDRIEVEPKELLEDIRVALVTGDIVNENVATEEDWAEIAVLPDYLWAILTESVADVICFYLR